ncbi:TPA: P-loop NTPase fold protein [Vibrio diabolicus]
MKLEERIHCLLEDDSFPSILLCDGRWGIGKTHYVKTTLKPYLDKHYKKSHKSIYLSLYGVSSLDDFKDRLLSLAYTKNENTASFARRSNSAADFSVQTFEGTRGVGKALSSIGSIVKQYYFNKINNLLIFIDDLERLSSDELRSQILGECLNLCEQKKVKIVVIGNQQKIKAKEDIEKADIEKAFGDIVTFSRSPSELIGVLDDMYTGYKALSESQKLQIEGILTDHKVDNIRVIRRSIDRYNAISGLFQRDDSLDYSQIDRNNLFTSFAVCIAIYNHGFTLDEVFEAFRESPYREETKRDDSPESLLRSLIHPLRHLATENHIRFLASYENNFKDLTTELKLPIAENKLQEILDYNFRKNDDDWLQERLPDIRQLIEKPKKEDFIIWIRACNVYLFMIDNFYVEGDTSKFVSHVEDRLGIFEFSASDDLEELRRDLKYYVHDKKLTELFSQFLSDTAKSEKNSKIESYKQRFRESWQLVVEESRFEHHDRFLQYFESEDFDYILEHWSNKDISDFVRFIRSRFNVVDCSEVYGQDKAPIESLLGSINLRRRQLPKGAQLGIITELQKEVLTIFKLLKTVPEFEEPV